MSKKAFRISSALGFLVLFSAPFLQAQPAIDLKVDVPFAFHAGTLNLPAGAYEIREMDDQPGTLKLRSEDGKNEEFLLTTELSDTRLKHKSELVFDLVGGQHYLRQVWEEGREIGRGLPAHEGKVTKSVRIACSPGMMKPAAAKTH